MLRLSAFTDLIWLEQDLETPFIHGFLLLGCGDPVDAREHGQHRRVRLRLGQVL